MKTQKQRLTAMAIGSALLGLSGTTCCLFGRFWLGLLLSTAAIALVYMTLPWVERGASAVPPDSN